MRLLWLLTLWAEGNTGGFQSIMGAAHIALGFRGLFLWYCHCLCVSLRVPAKPAFICISGFHPVLLTRFKFYSSSGPQGLDEVSALHSHNCLGSGYIHMSDKVQGKRPYITDAVAK